jgi:TonB-dependent starch-binding outer membrane protein SusC
LPTNLADSRASAHVNLSHSSPDKKFTISFKSIYSISKINLPTRDPGAIITMPPNLKLYDSTGMLNWEEGGVLFKNIGFSPDVHPLAVLQTKYAGEYQHLSNNLQIGLELFKGLRLNTNLGYNLVLSDEARLHPSTSLDPFNAVLPYAFFGNQTQKGWIAEPQLDYTRKMGKGKLAFLVGATWQENITKGFLTDASNYTSDLLLNSVAGAGKVILNNNYEQYKYTALFGRLNYNWADKYILNLSGRRDGSSRFGPQNRFNNFGAAGIAWIFSNEAAIKKLSFLSFGKLRASYGITGNDQIPNYRFQDTWASGGSTFQQEPVLLPTALFNPVLGWESNRKFEAAIDLGFLKDRLLFSTAYFKNLSGNQLVNYNLPIQAGFSSIVKNINALIENKGLEFTLQFQNISRENLQWNSSINLSIVRNKLVEFPGLETSSYANRYIPGEPLSVRMLYQSLGVDAATGVYSFMDADKDGLLSSNDRVIFKNTEPKYYGGLRNSISFKGLEIDVFFEFRKQEGPNYIGNLLMVPGYRFFNQPSLVLERWKTAGDNSSIQRYTATTATDAYKYAKSFLALSTAAFDDASYIRCKTVSVSYSLPVQWGWNAGVEKMKVYVQCQNLFTLTSFAGADPENQRVNALPLMKTITGGIQFIF